MALTSQPRSIGGRRNPSLLVAGALWIGGVLAGAVPLLLSVPDCGWSSSFLASFARPATVVAWIAAVLLPLALSR